MAARHTPKRLAGDATQITAACRSLTGSYQSALSTDTTAVAPIGGQVESALAIVRAARQTAEQTHRWTAFAATIMTSSRSATARRIRRNPGELLPSC